MNSILVFAIQLIIMKYTVSRYGIYTFNINVLFCFRFVITVEFVEFSSYVVMNKNSYPVFPLIWEAFVAECAPISQHCRCLTSSLNLDKAVLGNAW